MLYTLCIVFIAFAVLVGFCTLVSNRPRRAPRTDWRDYGARRPGRFTYRWRLWWGLMCTEIVLTILIGMYGLWPWSGETAMQVWLIMLLLNPIIAIGYGDQLAQANKAPGGNVRNGRRAL